MTITSVNYDCQNGEFGISIGANGKKFFVSYKLLEMMLYQNAEELDMVGFKAQFDSFRESVHELAWHTEGWDKHKKKRLEMRINNHIYKAYSDGVRDGIDFERKKKG